LISTLQSHHLTRSCRDIVVPAAAAAAPVAQQMLGSSFPPHGDATPMPKTKALMADLGATATNFFIHTPICCPSRSELLSGRYFHNIKQVGGGCMHVNESKVNGDTFARYVPPPATFAITAVFAATAMNFAVHVFPSCECGFVASCAGPSPNLNRI
jgi:hypothetical protein